MRENRCDHGNKKDPIRVFRSSGGGFVRLYAHAPAPLARQDHQLVHGEGFIATTIGAADSIRKP